MVESKYEKVHVKDKLLIVEVPESLMYAILSFAQMVTNVEEMQDYF